MNIFASAIAQRVQDGTTFGGADMCATCRYAFKRKGAQTGFDQTRCNAVQNSPIVPVKMASCSAYLEKGRMSLGEMNEVAWIVEARGKSIGFLSPEELDRRRQNGNPKTQGPPVGF